jgi:resuscitation-promoting factor RpfA
MGDAMSDVQISPLAKRLAEENSIDWRKIRGTGPEGRVIERDILTYLARIMSGEADLPAEPDKSEPTAPTNLPAAIPANMANFAAASAGLAKEGVDLNALIGGLPPAAPVSSTVEAMPPLDFGSLAAPTSDPVPVPQPVLVPAVVPVEAASSVVTSAEPVFEIDLDDGDDLVFEDTDETSSAVVEAAPTNPTDIATFSQPEIAVATDLSSPPAWTMPEVPTHSTEPAFTAPPVLATDPVVAPDPTGVTEPVWSAPEPVVSEIPVWTAPTEPNPMAWNAPEPAVVVSDPVLPVWSVPVATPPEPILPVWSAPEPVSVPEPAIAVVMSEPVVPAVVAAPVMPEVVPEPALPLWTAPEPVVAPEPAILAEPVLPVVAEPVLPVVEPVLPVAVPSIPEPAMVPSYIAPSSAVVSDFFQLFVARSQFNPKSLEDIRAQLKNSLNNREVPHELFLARAAARALHLLGLEKFSVARLESGGLQAYAINGLQHSFLEAVQGLGRATTTTGEGLLVVDASHLGVDDLVLPSAAGVLALGREGKLTLSGKLPPLQSTEFLQKVVELLEHPVGLVI